MRDIKAEVIKLIMEEIYDSRSINFVDDTCLVSINSIEKAIDQVIDAYTTTEPVLWVLFHRNGSQGPAVFSPGFAQLDKESAELAAKQDVGKPIVVPLYRGFKV